MNDSEARLREHAGKNLVYESVTLHDLREVLRLLDDERNALQLARDAVQEARSDLARVTAERESYRNANIIAEEKQNALVARLQRCEALLREADGALLHHVDQTRPIQRTTDTLARIDAYFAEEQRDA